jgi:hypothetical protein
MLKLTIDQILECVTAVTVLTSAEKAKLQAKLIDASLPCQYQDRQEQLMGDINIIGDGNAFAADQAFGNVNQWQSGAQVSMQNSGVQEALQLVEKLRQDIRLSDMLNRVEKATAEVPLKLVETELKKPQPDKSLVDQALSSLKKTLEGVKTLIGPVLEITAVIVKKVWGMP